MRITMELPDNVFRTPKTTEQITEELRQAAAIFWLARGDVAPEAVAQITALHPPPPSAGERTLYDLIVTAPGGGEDADFERSVEYAREIPAWDT